MSISVDLTLLSYAAWQKSLLNARFDWSCCWHTSAEVLTLSVAQPNHGLLHIGYCFSPSGRAAKAYRRHTTHARADRVASIARRHSSGVAQMNALLFLETKEPVCVRWKIPVLEGFHGYQSVPNDSPQAERITSQAAMKLNPTPTPLFASRRSTQQKEKVNYREARSHRHDS
jgi:hypothetical protein